ncbi:tRNA (adenosine(37)-N6)-dimethylallyltransferase MiaA [Terrilactibacillus sp. BCM23-1]|uniref:tRNA dimethylallyltransferase n=1 Tax=Terrilactibacillus tamarindi TaxID=2599694 RepID=A0A6N8CTA8_9BACI|nr:tRNA (adenosine(37)-N6)-dimethylallyltransferase MiaA [Terrilactibacillus tamarindi]MTT32898.1 tRNA (adenosine(37)-N6)-dimethylallyltransferase MiaA [Terrilactibacillus tamarindi]
MKDKVIVIVGPTAVGKTKMSVELSKRFNGEVINGDSMQVYKGLNIGTAKITEDEKEGIVHHLFDICRPEEAYTVADYQKDARKCIKEIQLRKKYPIVVGGTGLYIKAALYNYQFTEVKANEVLRQKFLKMASKKGPDFLHQHLQSLSPDTAQTIHPHNIQRVIRALEKAYSNDGKGDKSNDPNRLEPLFDITVIGLTMDRELLYSRINDRVDQMIKKGLLDEAKDLYDLNIRDSQAARAIGYKELFLYFDGECSLDEAINLLKRNSRRYAKRQFTWFKHQMDVNWFNMDRAIQNFSHKVDEVVLFLEKQGLQPL